MRIRRDKTNYNASNVLRKLDRPPEAVKWRSKKNTKRWCRGKAGREHKWDIIRITRNQMAPPPYWPTHSFLVVDWQCYSCRKADVQIIYK